MQGSLRALPVTSFRKEIERAFRSDEGRLFTLAGNLGGFQVGDRVVMVGTVAAVSFCMQGITLGVLHICKQELKASQAA